MARRHSPTLDAGWHSTWCSTAKEAASPPHRSWALASVTLGLLSSNLGWRCRRKAQRSVRVESTVRPLCLTWTFVNRTWRRVLPMSVSGREPRALLSLTSPRPHRLLPGRCVNDVRVNTLSRVDRSGDRINCLYKRTEELTNTMTLILRWRVRRRVVGFSFLLAFIVIETGTNEVYDSSTSHFLNADTSVAERSAVISMLSLTPQGNQKARRWTKTSPVSGNKM